MSDETISDQLQLYLDRLRAGDTSVHTSLWDLVNDRLTLLAQRLKRGPYRRVGAWEQTEDVAQNARMRLIRALSAQVPATPRDFYGLANLQIRRELLDIIRQHAGRSGDRKPMAELPEDPSADTGAFDPAELTVWREFHEFVDAMPESEREIVELLWYQGLTQDQAAEILGVDKSTVKRRWRELRPKLANILPETE